MDINEQYSRRLTITVSVAELKHMVLALLDTKIDVDEFIVQDGYGGQHAISDTSLIQITGTAAASERVMVIKQPLDQE